MEGGSSYAPQKYRKFRSRRRKKRKGFFGKRAWELAKGQSKYPEETLGSGGTAISKSDESSTTRITQKSEDKGPKVSPTQNVFAEKLLNSSFEITEEEGHLTRSKTKKLGLAKDGEASEAARGYKLQDAALLSEVISAAAICSSCRRSDSKLQLFQNNLLRNGLSEHLFIECDKCGNKTPLNTSKRLGGKGGGSHEVNRRSVLASRQWGLTGLTRFCAGMGLPPPVTKKAYNQHLTQIEMHSIANAEE